MAYQGHVVIPTTHENAQHVVEHIIRTATAVFGGASCYRGEGAWDGEHGVEHEDHARVVVNAEDRHKLRVWLHGEARYVKHMLDEESVMYELQETEVGYV